MKKTFAAVAVLAALVIAVPVMASGEEPPRPSGEHVVVGPGETLWDVAVRHTPKGEDPRVLLTEIQAINGLESGSVQAWEVILLPAR